MEEARRQEIEATPLFKQRFEAESLEGLIGRTRYALYAAFIVYPAFWILDRVIAPEHSIPFLLIRLAVMATYAFALVMFTRPAGRRIAIWLSVGVVYSSALGIAVMIPAIGGFKSQYYVGILMAFFVAGLFMQWTARATWVCGALIIGSYFAINLATTPVQGWDVRDMAFPFFFLTGSMLFAVWANMDKEKSRRLDLAQRLLLEQNAEELKALDEAKTRFFSNVSHELRSPLTMILGPLEAMMQERHDEERHKLYEAMDANARRLLRTVNGLLDFAKMDAGKLKCKYSDGNMGKLLEALVKAAIPLAERRGIRLAMEGLDDVPDSVFDENKMETVAANLISNAIKFTPENGTITARAFPDPRMIIFEVEDTGCGIPEDHIGSLFQRFVQVDSTLSRRTGGGTGLGLAMVKELTELHMGKVEVASVLGKGTKFRVEIPRTPDMETGPERRQSAGRRKSDQIADVRNKTLLAMHYEEKTSKKVLLSDVEAHRMEIQARRAPEVAEGAPDDAPRVLMIDDNPDIRNFVGRALARTYRVELAEDGVDGIEKARLAPPDLIITDVMMPRMDGYEFCRTIRKDEAFRKTPIIIVTAEFGTEKIVKGLDVGASDFVQKPFEMRELEARVSAHLRTIGLERSLEERDRRLNVIGQMTSTIVHDLKNPLSNIIMYAQIARQDAVDEGRTDYVEDLDTVIRESKRLGLLIAEVLDFARGNISELQMERTVLKPFIEEMMKPLERQLFGHGVAIYFKHGAAEDLAVDLDRLRTQRVLENLVKNSREAILGAGVKTGESSIWISTSGAADGVVIRVADNGPGIPPEMAKTLFEPFATAGKKSGTGLGLAIARSQVSAQGGTIEVLEKPPEGGAAFVLKFPNPKLPA